MKKILLIACMIALSSCRKEEIKPNVVTTIVTPSVNHLESNNWSHVEIMDNYTSFSTDSNIWDFKGDVVFIGDDMKSFHRCDTMLFIGQELYFLNYSNSDSLVLRKDNFFHRFIKVQ